MSFWDDFAEGLKDVGTSATRIVTDTAIDIGNVATGFEFNSELEGAKQSLSDAGVLSAADAIKKNHYPFLDTMEREARDKLAQVQSLHHKGRTIEMERDQLIDELSNMCADVSSLTEESLEAEALFAEAQGIPEWEKWATILDIPRMSIAQVDQISLSMKKWEKVGNDIAMSGLVVGVVDGTAAVVALAASAKAARAGSTAAVKAGTQTSRVAVKASKFAKIGKLAGRASGVLAVVSVGLDIGLSVAEMESQKAELETTLAELNSGIAEANSDLAALQRENAGILSRITELLASVEPAQTRGTWEDWVDSTRAGLRAVIDRLVSVDGIMSRARRKAETTRGRPLDLRVRLVAAVDPGISEQEAREIIGMVDLGVGKADPISEDDVTVQRVAGLKWCVEGPGETAITPSSTSDRLTCSYGVPDDHGRFERTWTYYATAPWTRMLPLQWKYAAKHPPQRPFGTLSAFSEGPSGRQFSTLHDTEVDAPGPPATGASAIQVYKGQVFGFIMQSRASVDPSSDLHALCGTYKREPVQNPWHVGTVGVQDESAASLIWTNDAGVSWDLVPDLEAGVLRKTAGSPYQEEPTGGTEFTLLRKDGRVTGFEFMGETYVLDLASTRASLQSVCGEYRREPVENDWHVGAISRTEDDALVWTNLAGVTWALTADLDARRLDKQTGSPYQDLAGGDHFTILSGEGRVSGFMFLSEEYVKAEVGGRDSGITVGSLSAHFSI